MEVRRVWWGFGSLGLLLGDCVDSSWLLLGECVVSQSQL